MPNLDDFIFVADLDNVITPPLFLKILFVVTALFFVFAIVYLLSKSQWLERLILKDIVEFLSFKSYEMRKVPKVWAKITNRLEKGVESETKLAVIEADDLLNDILERMGYTGETLGEKLNRLSKTTLSNLDEVLEVHKIKSNIIHDPAYRLSLDQARMVLEIYGKALSNLEAL